MNRDLAKQKAEALVAQMTVEEVASQLRFDAPAVDRLGANRTKAFIPAMKNTRRSNALNPRWKKFRRKRRSRWRVSWKRLWRSMIRA